MLRLSPIDLDRLEFEISSEHELVSLQFTQRPAPVWAAYWSQLQRRATNPNSNCSQPLTATVFAVRPADSSSCVSGRPRRQLARLHRLRPGRPAHRRAARPRGRGRGRLVPVRPGSGYSSGPDGLVLRPGSAEDAAAALRELTERGCAPERVVHLWTLDPGDGTSPGCLQRGLHTLIAFAKAAGNLGFAPWSLEIVTSGAQRVLPGDPLAPSSARCSARCG